MLFERLELTLFPSWVMGGVKSVHLLAVEYNNDNTTLLSLYNYLVTHCKAHWNHDFICSTLPKSPRISCYYAVSHLTNWGSEKTFLECHNNQAVKPRFNIQFSFSNLHYCKYQASFNHLMKTVCQNTFLKTNSDGILQYGDLPNIHSPIYLSTCLSNNMNQKNFNTTSKIHRIFFLLICPYTG